MSHPWIAGARKPDAEKHREPTEMNIDPHMLKQGGTAWQGGKEKEPGLLRAFLGALSRPRCHRS